MLNHGTASSGRRSVIVELVVGVALIAGVSTGVYKIQHPHMTQQQQIMAAFNQ